MVPHVEVVVEAEDVDIATHRRRLAQTDRNQDAALCIKLTHLAEVVDAIEVTQLRGIGGGNLTELLFLLEPDRHRIYADVLPRQAREEQLSAVLTLKEV